MSKLCSVEGCTWKHKAKGFCKKHYHQFKQGMLAEPEAPRGLGGVPLSYGFEVRKIDSVWHRRPTGSKEPWVPVVWGASTKKVHYSWKPIKHGENSGYYQHLRRGEAACEACADAHREHNRKQREAA